jgi:hypothetical protein
MSVGFKAVQWNRRKIIYDGILVANVVLFIGAFMSIGALRIRQPTHQPGSICASRRSAPARSRC